MTLLQQVKSSGIRPGALMMEFPVNPDLAPILVSSTRSVLWIPHILKKNRVRAAVRDVPLPIFYTEVLAAVERKGSEEQWGNIISDAPLPGLLAAVAHLKDYGIEEIEVLVNPEHPPEIESFIGGKVCEVEWVPSDRIVVVPEDREYLGFVMGVRDGLVSVIHNAARGLGIVVLENTDGMAGDGA